ncbi:MAG: hypothetical protein HQK96_18500 [Nitrospirae bacterium]|nr:hypothetical protein [Nitrospirota bacterium]
MLKQMLESLFTMGSGNAVELSGESSLKASFRRKYTNSVKEIYFDTLSSLTTHVTDVLKKNGLVPLIGDEEWVGTFTGSMSNGESQRFQIELGIRVPGTDKIQKVKNSMLILNIQKDNGRKLRYELNSYLS